MMRLLFLCLLLLRAAVSQEKEGSGDDEFDDEDYVPRDYDRSINRPSDVGTSKGDNADEKFTLIIIIVAVAVLALSVATIITIFLVRRRMVNRQQGIYSVPTEQEQKGAI